MNLWRDRQVGSVNQVSYIIIVFRSVNETNILWINRINRFQKFATATNLYRLRSTIVHIVHTLRSIIQRQFVFRRWFGKSTSRVNQRLSFLFVSNLFYLFANDILIVRRSYKSQVYNFTYINGVLLYLQNFYFR